MEKKLRLDKFLVEMGVDTRSQIKEAAKKGRIRVNGTVEKRTDRKIDLETEQVFYDGKLVSYVETEYYMLYKPQGVVSATEDKLHRTVLDLIEEKQRKDLFPVGRLDIDTEGLLLITNDGELAHRLLSPKRHVNKRYYAWIEGELPDTAREQFEKGIVLNDGTMTMPAKLEIALSKADGLQEGIMQTQVFVTVQEGKFHQVKRMFEALGCRVAYLKRVSMGPLLLDEGLRPGEYRRLTKDEILGLKRQM